MKINEIALLEDTAIDEMSLKHFSQLGNFEKPGPFRETDKKLLQHPTNHLKLIKFFERTDYDFRIFASNLPKLSQLKESGQQQDDVIRKFFGKDADEILDRGSDDITVVFIGNSGADKVMITPWIMAHRFGHAIRASKFGESKQKWDYAINYFEKQIVNIIKTYYNLPHTVQIYNNVPVLNGIFNALGTQRSSRAGKINRPYEFMYEMFAQYLKTGAVTLNPLPNAIPYGRSNWGRRSNMLQIDRDYADIDDRMYPTNQLSVEITDMFNDVLNSAAGNIFVI